VKAYYCPECGVAFESRECLPPGKRLACGLRLKCPVCGARVRVSGHLLIVLGSLAILFTALILDDVTWRFGAIIGGALIGLGCLRLIHQVRRRRQGEHARAIREWASRKAAPETFERIAVLDSEVQAQVLDATLADRGIPHVIHSYYSRAYDGLFQLSSGWGHVEAPSKFREEIHAILEGMSEGGKE